MSYSKLAIVPLSNDQLFKIAPAIFASQAAGNVSDRYQFLPTIEVIEGLRKEGWQPVKALEMNVRQEGRHGFQKHCIRFQRPEDMEAARNSEAFKYAPSEHRIVKGEITPELLLINSHDRSSAYQIHAGLFRLVCSNGLIVCDSTFSKISVRHTGNDVQDVIEASYQVAKEVPAIVDQVAEMKGKQLSLPARQAFAEAGLILKYGGLEEAPINAERLLTPRRREDASGSLWNTFNVLQENLTQGGLRFRTPATAEKRARGGRTRGVNSIDENTKLNKALWHIAEKLKAM